jgi:hypothetical protein
MQQSQGGSGEEGQHHNEVLLLSDGPFQPGGREVETTTTPEGYFGRSECEDGYRTDL